MGFRVVISVLLLCALTGCTGVLESVDSDSSGNNLSLSLPSFDTLAFGMVSSKSAPFVSQVASDWGLPAPTTLAEISCFAVAVDWPNASNNAIKCSQSDGSTLIPGLFQGLYRPGDSVDLNVPAGSGRKVYLLGFASDSTDVCTLYKNAASIPKPNLSPPIVLGTVEVAVTGAKRSVSLTADISSAKLLSDCTGEVIDGVSVPADEVEAPPTITGPLPELPSPPPNSAPKTNAMSCATPPTTGLTDGDLVCYGLWDFGDSFGNDQAMCAQPDENGYSSPEVGCVISTSACVSGKALASRVLNIYRPWDSAADGVGLATDAEVSVIAANLSSDAATVRQQLVRLWEYNCIAASSVVNQPPASEVPPPPAPVAPPPPDSLPPRTNNFHCVNPLNVGLETDELACYGLWDFGDAFGNDQAMCSEPGESAYSASAIGCVISTSACASGKATATRILNTYAAWDSASDGIDLASMAEATEIAERLISSASLVQSQLIRVWEYRCNAPAMAPPPPPATGVDVHIINIYEASSNHSVVGNVLVTIAPGANRVILALGSYESVDWILTGDVDRVDKVILQGYEAQSVTGINEEKVESHSYDVTREYFYRVSSGGDWSYRDPNSVTAKAYAAEVQTRTGGIVKSIQGAYRASEFSIGFGPDQAVELPASSLNPSWVYIEDIHDAYDNAGSPQIMIRLNVAGENTIGVYVDLDILHVTTSDVDLTPMSQTVLIPAGSNYKYVFVPVTVDALVEGIETYKVKLSNPKQAIIPIDEVEGRIRD